MPSDVPPLGVTEPLVPPLFQSAVYTIPDLDALDRIYNAEAPGFIYARDAHPNARALAAKLARGESAAWAVVTSSGMAGSSPLVLGTVSKGERIVASDRLYGRTVQLFTQELPRLGVNAELVDACELSQVRKALRGGARML